MASIMAKGTAKRKQMHVLHYGCCFLSRFSTSEFFRAKRLFLFVLELSAEKEKSHFARKKFASGKPALSISIL